MQLAASGIDRGPTCKRPNKKAPKLPSAALCHDDQVGSQNSVQSSCTAAAAVAALPPKAQATRLFRARAGEATGREAGWATAARGADGNGCGGAELELPQQIVEGRGLLRERMAGSRLFLDHGGVLLRALVHVVDGGVDLLQAGSTVRAWRSTIAPTWRLISWTSATIVGQRLAGFADQPDAGIDLRRSRC